MDKFWVANYIDQAIEFSFSGWIPIPESTLERIRCRAFECIDDALLLIEEKLHPSTLEFLCHLDVARVAVALATEHVIDHLVIDWFVDDTLRFIAREARVRAALVHAQD